MSGSIQEVFKLGLQLVQQTSAGDGPSLDVALALEIVQHGKRDRNDWAYPFKIQATTAESWLQHACVDEWTAVAKDRQALSHAVSPLVVLLSLCPSGPRYALDFKQLKQRIRSALRHLGRGPHGWGQTAAQHFMSCKLAMKIVEQFELDKAATLAGHHFSCTKTVTGSLLHALYQLAATRFPSSVSPDLNDSKKFFVDNPWFLITRNDDWNASDQIVSVNFKNLLQHAKATRDSGAAAGGSSTPAPAAQQKPSAAVATTGPLQAGSYANIVRAQAWSTELVEAFPKPASSSAADVNLSIAAGRVIEELSGIARLMWPPDRDVVSFLQYELAVALIESDATLGPLYPRWSLQGSAIGNCLKTAWSSWAENPVNKMRKKQLASAAEPFQSGMKQFVESKCDEYFSVLPDPRLGGNWICVLDVKRMTTAGLQRLLQESGQSSQSTSETTSSQPSTVTAIANGTEQGSQATTTAASNSVPLNEVGLSAMAGLLWPQNKDALSFLQFRVATAVMQNNQALKPPYRGWSLTGAQLGGVLNQAWLDWLESIACKGQSSKTKIVPAPFKSKALRKFVEEDMDAHFVVARDPQQPNNWICVLDINLVKATCRRLKLIPSQPIHGGSSPSTPHPSSASTSRAGNSKALLCNGPIDHEGSLSEAAAAAKAPLATHNNTLVNVPFGSAAAPPAIPDTECATVVNLSCGSVAATQTPPDTHDTTPLSVASGSISSHPVTSHQGDFIEVFSPRNGRGSLRLDPSFPLNVTCSMVTACNKDHKWSKVAKQLQRPACVLGLRGLFDKNGNPTALVVASVASLNEIRCHFVEIPHLGDRAVRPGLQAILTAGDNIKVVHAPSQWLAAFEQAIDVKASGQLIDIQLLDSFLHVLKLLNGKASGVLDKQPAAQDLQQMMEWYYPDLSKDWQLPIQELCWPENINTTSTALSQSAAMPAIMALLLFEAMRDDWQDNMPLGLLSQVHLQGITWPQDNQSVNLLKVDQQHLGLSGSARRALTGLDTLKLTYVINDEHKVVVSAAGLNGAAAVRRETGISDIEEEPVLVDAPSGVAHPQDGDAQDEEGTADDEDPDVRFMMNLMPPAITHTIPEEWIMKGGAATIVEFVADSGRQLQVKFAGSACTEPVGAVVDMEQMLQHLDRGVNPEQTEQNTRSDVAEMSRRLFWRRDNRLTLQQSLHRISAIKDINGLVTGLTMRIGRHIPGVARIVEDVLHAMCHNFEENAQDAQEDHTLGITPTRGVSLLLVGRPGSGKTTLLRDVIRVLADECRQDVVLVDTSNEVAGEGTVAHPCIGRARRMMVTDRSKQHDVMLEAVHNHMPEVVVIDELGRDEEVKAACEISRRGIMMVATVVADLKGLIKSPVLNQLLGGKQTVTLGDSAAKETNHGNKTRTERRGAPAFSILVEVLGGRRYRVHPSSAASVDAILDGKDPPCHIRSYDSQGNMTIQFEAEQQAVQQISQLLQEQGGVPQAVLQRHAAAAQTCNAVLNMMKAGVQTRLQAQLTEAIAAYSAANGDQTVPTAVMDSGRDVQQPGPADQGGSLPAAGQQGVAQQPAADLPLLRFDGTIKYAQTHSDAESQCAQLLRHGPDVVGMDAEWVPERVPGRYHPVALLQLCYYAKGKLHPSVPIPDSKHFVVLLIPIIHTRIPRSLYFILSNSNIRKVGVGLEKDARKIMRDWSHCVVHGLDDVAQKALKAPTLKSHNKKQWGLAGLVEVLLTRYLPKPDSVRCGKWDQWPLSQEQQQYAALDAYASLATHLALERLSSHGGDNGGPNCCVQ